MREVLGEAYMHEGRLTRTFFFLVIQRKKVPTLLRSLSFTLDHGRPILVLGLRIWCVMPFLLSLTNSLTNLTESRGNHETDVRISFTVHRVTCTVKCRDIYSVNCHNEFHAWEGIAVNVIQRHKPRCSDHRTRCSLVF